MGIMWRNYPQKLLKKGGAAEEMGFIISKSSLRGGLQSDVAISINIRHPPDLRSKAMGIYLCFRIKKLKFLSSTFCRQKVESKPRGDKFSGSQLVVGKMVAFALLRVKRSPFLNPPPALCPFSKNSSAAFLLSPTE